MSGCLLLPCHSFSPDGHTAENRYGAVNTMLCTASTGVTTLLRATVGEFFCKGGANVRIFLHHRNAPGEAVSKEELENLFKRFYRPDKTRTQNGSYGWDWPLRRALSGITEERSGRRAKGAAIPFLPNCPQSAE